MNNFINTNNSKTKYMFLYNLDDEYSYFEEVMVNKLKTAIPETKILNFCLYKEDLESNIIHHGKGKSIWVPYNKYLIAWTICNYEELLNISFTENDCDTTADDGIHWFELHNKEQYIKYM